MFEVIVMYAFLTTQGGQLTFEPLQVYPSVEACQTHARQMSFMPVPRPYVLAGFTCQVVEEREA